MSSPRPQDGFSLVEALLAIALLGLALTAILPSFLTYADNNTLSETRTGALAAAQLVMEDLRRADPAAMPDTGDGPVRIVPVGSQEFEVTPRYCVRAAFCGPRSRHVRVEVRWGGRTIYDLETVYTRLR